MEAVSSQVTGTQVSTHLQIVADACVDAHRVSFEDMLTSVFTEMARTVPDTTGVRSLSYSVLRSRVVGPSPSRDMKSDAEAFVSAVEQVSSVRRLEQAVNYANSKWSNIRERSFQSWFLTSGRRELTHPHPTDESLEYLLVSEDRDFRLVVRKRNNVVMSGDVSEVVPSRKRVSEDGEVGRPPKRKGRGRSKKVSAQSDDPVE